MAQFVYFAASPGQTLTASLIDDSVSPATVAYSSVSMSEAPASSGLYLAEFDPGSLISGNYRLAALNAGAGVAQYDCDFAGVASEIINAVEFTSSETTTGIAAAVWDALTADYQNAGSTGLALTDAGGGGASVIVYPIISNSPQRTNETTLKAYIDEVAPFDVAPVDADGVAVDTRTMTLQIVIEDRQNADVETILDAAITKTATTYSFSTTTSNLGMGQKTWSCRDTGNGDLVISTGNYVVSYSPS
mgnify:CR=1 FL=1